MKNFILVFFIGILLFGNSFQDSFAFEYDNNEKGIYFFDGVKQKIVKFFNYTDEFDSTSNPKIIDDGKKAVYSIGDGIFMKNFSDFNFLNSEDEDVGNFGNFNINENSVKLFKTEIQGESLLLSWKDDDLFDGYLIHIKDDVDGFLNPNSNNLVYILNKEGKDLSFLSSEIKKNKKIFLTNKKFEKAELKIFLNENFFYAKIFGIKDGEISTGSAQKILYGNTNILKPKEIGKIEKIKFPILVENTLNISDLFFTDVNIGDVFSWDFDGDGVFEKEGEEVFLSPQQNLGHFFVSLKIIKKTGEQFIKKIELNFFSPEIFFDKDVGGKIFGHIDPVVDNFPISYLYEVDGETKKSSDKIFTNKDGNFNFYKKSEKKSRNIYGEFGDKIGEFFFNTGEIRSYKNNSGFYYLDFLSGENGFSSVGFMHKGERYLDFFTKVDNSDGDSVFENNLNNSTKIKIGKILYSQIGGFGNFRVIKNNLATDSGFLRVLRGDKTILVISSIGQIKFYDNDYKFIFNDLTETSFDFFLVKNGEKFENKFFYFNFGVDLK